jgi:type IV secretion system protein VirD4
MRWPKLVVLALALGLTIYALVYIYPLAAPLIHHPPQEGILSALFSDLISPHHESGLAAYYAFAVVGIGFVCWLLIGYDIKHRPRRTHGSARHANRREARQYRGRGLVPTRLRRPGRILQALQRLRRARSRPAFLLHLGKYQGGDVVLDEEKQYQHLLLTGPTGAGKSARFFIPNLLQERGTHSLFIADLKNELYRKCAGWLSQYMQIWLFAPLQPQISCGYNPLAHIKSVEDAQDFAETWVVNTGTNTKDTFWETNSKLLISAMALHLVETERAPAFSRLADMLTTRSYEEIRDTLRRSRSQAARYLAGQFLENMESNERLIGSQMTETGNRFQLLASPQARAVTATDDIDFEEMMSTPTAFFLSIPRTETRRYRPLLAALTQQMFAAWERRGTNGIRCYLDEFSNLGHIPDFADFIATARALKVALLMAIQNFSQLDGRYGKHDADTIKNNAVTHLLLPGAGLEECRYYSERIGDTTVVTSTVNKRGYGLTEDITVSESETRRRLMTPDELRTMQRDQMLMLEASSQPMILTTKPYFLERWLAERVSIPYYVSKVRVRQASTSPGSAPRPQGLPPAQPTGSTVDADEDDDQNDQFFQNIP